MKQQKTKQRKQAKPPVSRIKIRWKYEKLSENDKERKP